MRTALLLALLGLGLLGLSALPWPPGGSGAASATATASPPGSVDYGRQLFVAKGCVGCHRHDAVPNQTGFFGEGPNLSRYQPDSAFLRAWLRDPQAVRPATTMPDLALSDAEIEALIAFLAAATTD